MNRSFFELVLGSGLVPVVSSIALGADSQLYNVNADQMASACASGTGCASLIYLTDVPGVRDENGAVLRTSGKVRNSQPARPRNPFGRHAAEDIFLSGSY